MHETVAVNHLERERGAVKHLLRRAGYGTGGITKQRPNALAAAKERIPHRPHKTFGTDARLRQHFFGKPLKVADTLLHPSLELEFGG